MTKSVTAAELRERYRAGGEIAIVDAREEASFHRRHLLMASCLPLSRLELLAPNLLPRKSAPVVVCDDGGGLAERAARRLAEGGWSDVAVLAGGIAAWEQAGLPLYSGVHVPSKAFAEVVEHEMGTPWIGVEELAERQRRGDDLAIFDSRSYEEYHSNSIPGAISVPGAELVYRFADLVASPDTFVVVNCGGRTRSIIGAQGLIDAQVPNRVVSLKNGTMAWHLAGFEVVRGAERRMPPVSPAGIAAARERAERVARHWRVPVVDRARLDEWRHEADRRTLYLLDVRDPAEYRAGHLPGSLSAPGGQLVQETDAHIATWGGRIVLVDDNGVRATMTASWLKQMGWGEVAVLVARPGDGEWAKGRHVPRVLGLDDIAVATIEPAALRESIASGSVVVDLDFSRNYRRGHIPGAWFAIRSGLTAALAKLPNAETIVLTSPDGVLAKGAAAELADRGTAAPVRVLAGGTNAWVAAGLPLEEGPSRMASEPDDVVLSARERGQGREEAMREYLAWEINLVNDMATDDDQRFHVVA